MAEYYVNEAAFTLPDRTFVDRTLHALESKLPGGGALGVSVARRPLEAGKSLREIVDASVAADDARRGGFTILARTETAIDGAPAILLRARWRKDVDVSYELQAHVAIDGKWLMFSVTSPLAEQAACDAQFEALVQSLTWRTA